MEHTHYAVSAHRDGYLRAGRPWTMAAELVSREDLTEAQVELLTQDPRIAIVPTTPAEALADATRAALLRTATGLAPADAERTKGGKLALGWLEAATGLADVTAAERDAAETAAKGGGDGAAAAKDDGDGAAKGAAAKDGDGGAAAAAKDG